MTNLILVVLFNQTVTSVISSAVAIAQNSFLYTSFGQSSHQKITPFMLPDSVGRSPQLFWSQFCGSTPLP
ncbi:MAG: hypothetical protein ACRC8Y_16595 [Chroococcales cyanobacterium]